MESMGGPEAAWRPGRKDLNDGTTSPPDGRLPNADMGSELVYAPFFFNSYGISISLQ